MKGVPCINPQCSSCGKPHPNCKCMLMAEGGDVIPSDKVILDKPKDEIPADKVVLDAIPSNEVVLDKDKYGSTSQQFLTGVEGVAQGIAGPVAPFLENKVLGVPYEDIAGRAKANPWTHGITEAGGIAGSFMLPVGQGKLIAQAAKAATGSKALRLALEGISFAGSDEITKALLRQPGVDPEETAASMAIHMATNGLLFAATGPLFGLAGKALDQVGGQKMIDAATKALTKIAESKPVSKVLELGVVSHAMDPGPELSKQAARGYLFLRKYLEPQIEEIIGKPLAKANKYVADAILHALKEGNLASIHTAARAGRYVSQGVKSYLPHIEGIFKGAYTELVPEAHKQLEDALREDVESGALQKQMEENYQQGAINGASNGLKFARGGEVGLTPKPTGETDQFGQLYPEQNIILNQMKGRVHEYLNSIRPLEQSKLPFDETTKQTAQKKSYDRALSFAVNPLRILNFINKGTLTPADMKHFTSLHPEIYRLLSKKMTERIIKSQLSGEKPPYAKRLAMSLFLGANLDSSTTPQAIQAAQGVFNVQKEMRQQMQQPKKNRRGTSTLGKTSQSYLTDDQAREYRQQRFRS